MHFKILSHTETNLYWKPDLFCFFLLRSDYFAWLFISMHHHQTVWVTHSITRHFLKWIWMLEHMCGICLSILMLQCNMGRQNYDQVKRERRFIKKEGTNCNDEEVMKMKEKCLLLLYWGICGVESKPQPLYDVEDWWFITIQTEVAEKNIRYVQYPCWDHIWNQPFLPFAVVVRFSYFCWYLNAPQY